MITNVLLGMVTTIVSGIDSLIPHFSLPAFFTGGSIVPPAVIDFIAASLYTISPFFPSAFLASMFAALMTIWPAVLAFTIFEWIYRHIPSVAGFGLGGG